MIKLVNENKLYKVIDRFFSSDAGLLGELIQNSQRAGAENIEINYNGTTLSIEDDGKGISDLKSLLGIAFSDWSEEIEKQEPAGLGFLQLISNSVTVSIRSKFGSILVDCKRFIDDSDYKPRIS